MSHHDHHSHTTAARDIGDAFSTDTDGLPSATSPETVDLNDGDVFDLHIHPVRKRIGDAEVRMLGYNGSIPGDEKLLHYVRSVAESAELVSSVGTGSLILAAAGLLEGKRATTHWAYRRVLEGFGATYQRRRWVEDGKFIMSAGVSAGIDMGLQLAARLTDEASARQAQLWLDYDPQPPFGALDYDDMGWTLRAGRAWMSLTAPLLAARPRRLTRRERKKGSYLVEPSKIGGQR